MIPGLIAVVRVTDPALDVVFATLVEEAMAAAGAVLLAFPPLLARARRGGGRE